MKKLFLYVLFIISYSLSLLAQENEISPYCLKGAVPEVNGKVVFSRSFKLPDVPAGHLYDHLYRWTEKRLKSKNDSLIYAGRDEGLIVLTGIDTLVFSQKAFFTDESSVSYIITLLCLDDYLEVTVEDLYYEYTVSYMNKPETYYAEELITDKAALKSKGKKLKKKEGKFRRHTIDYVNAIYTEIKEAGYQCRLVY